MQKYKKDWKEPHLIIATGPCLETFAALYSAS